VLPAILKKIDDKKRRVDIIVATGLHVKLGSEAKAKLLGGRIVSRYKVLDHDFGPRDTKMLGRTRRGAPIALDKKIFGYDAIVSIGTVEPHLYAGYSGGAKTVAIGLAGTETVDCTHGTGFLGDPGTRLGSVVGNPFQDALWEIAGKTSLAYSVNIVNDQSGRPSAIFCGAPREVFAGAVRYARRIYEIDVRGEADIAIAGIGYPKDINLYQASRAVNYIANVERPVVKKGGSIIVCAELADGIGESASEKLFHKTLKAIASPREFLETIARKGCIAGEHRAFMMARPLIDYRVIFVSPGNDRIFDGTPIRNFRSPEAALGHARSAYGSSTRTYVIPHALATIACVKGG
jgi:nickel-dependent lactate racemase